MNTRKSIFDWYFKSSLLLGILIGLLLGALTGIVGGSSILWISPLGDLFIRLLKNDRDARYTCVYYSRNC